MRGTTMGISLKEIEIYIRTLRTVGGINVISIILGDRVGILGVRGCSNEFPISIRNIATNHGHSKVDYKLQNLGGSEVSLEVELIGIQ